MFDLSRNNMFSLFSIETGQTFQDHVIAFCGARCENYFSWVGSYQLSNLVSCLLNCCGCVPSILMIAGVRVAVVFDVVWSHGVEDPIVQGSCGLVVQVDDFGGGEEVARRQ